MGTILPIGPNALLLPGNPTPAPPRYFAVPDGLVTYWGFDADNIITNTIISDLSGANNYGTLTGGVTFSANSSDGQIGRAINITSNTNYAISSLVYNTVLISESVWFKCSSAPVSRIHIAGFSNGYNSATTDKVIFIESTSTGKVGFMVYTSGQKIVETPTSFCDGLWHHIVGTYDNSVVRCYVDGGLVGSLSAPGPPFTGYSVPNIMVGGQAPGFCTGSGNLYVDDFRVYNRALDAGEVMELYAAGIQGLRTRMLGMDIWDASIPTAGAAAVGGAKLRRNATLNGLSASGPFFSNPLASPIKRRTPIVQPQIMPPSQPTIGPMHG